MTSLTRGPLTPGVYWRRRLAVLGIVLLLVLGVSRMLGGGGDDNEPKASNVAARTSPTASGTPSSSPTSASPGASAAATTVPGATAPVTPTPTPTVVATPTLPAPTGRCSDDDIVATPAVTGAQATRTVIIRLTLRTLVTTACTWRASSSSLQLKITSGSDRIWSTLDCPRAITTKDVVVRRDTDAVVDVAWSSRRSDEDCSSHTQWAMPGYYHVSVAALGGEPHEIQFPLRRPRPLPKPAPKPTPTAAAAPTAGARQEPQSNPKKKHRRVD